MAARQQHSMEHRIARILSCTILICLNAIQMIIVLVFFMGGQASDALYIYLNVAQMGCGSAIFVALLIFLLHNNADSWAEYCVLIPSIVHVMYHTAAFIVTYNIIGSPHTVGSLVAALCLMIGLSAASVGPALTHLHNA